MLFQRKTVSCPVAYDSLPLSTELEELSFIVFDTETTGFQVGADDRLLEIGAVSIKGLKVQEEDIFQSYVNPNRQISREIIQLTSITTEKVENAPQATEAIASFFHYVGEREAVCLVGHYVSFDTLVFKHELKRGKQGLRGLCTIDTLDLIGFIAPSYDMRDLERYAMAFGTRIYKRHSALGDALTTAYLFTELLLRTKERGVRTWGELLKAVKG
ncbi:exonuclease domain-containing protein [Mesobacillus foraminis]|uniref:3'-5' exonuclease n=1 Tax=Mesobacillus foraminis TaxID=279826 RepID=UPI0039A01CB6